MGEHKLSYLLTYIIMFNELPSADHCLYLTSTPADSQSVGTVNVRSLLNKYDDIVEVCCDHQVDIVSLSESWHDTDSILSIVLGPLRCSGYNVVDRPRPSAADAEDLSVNHGGIVVVSTASILLSPIVVELICVRAVIRSFAAIVITSISPWL